MNNDFCINSLKGQYLIAKPGMDDVRFAKSVIYVCAHTEQGAMGLVVNHPLKTLTFADILRQLHISPIQQIKPFFNVFLGGPVETSRGLVLHSNDYAQESTIDITPKTRLTATLDILKDINDDNGPEDFLVALGFASWTAGQLESELYSNTWINLKSDDNLIFRTDTSKRWEAAMDLLKIDPYRYHNSYGNA